jgi:hypothetical protein
MVYRNGEQLNLLKENFEDIKRVIIFVLSAAVNDHACAIGCGRRVYLCYLLWQAIIFVLSAAVDDHACATCCGRRLYLCYLICATCYGRRSCLCYL